MGGESAEARLLQGFRILDLTQGMAGPWATMLLAQYGAEVIKVEPPAGDACRWLPPFAQDLPGHERSLTFAYLNRGKHSVVLNLEVPAGREVLLHLLDGADALIEGFPPGVIDRWGLGHRTLLKRRSSLVVTSVTEFGQDGPYRDYQAGHVVHCALAAWSHGVGPEDGAPMQCGGSVTAYIGGSVACLATLAALWHVMGTGQGQYVDVSTLEACLEVAGYAISDYAHRRIPRARTPGNNFPGAVPCADGWVGLNALSYRNWANLCHLMERKDLLEDHRFDTSDGRRANGPELRDTATGWAADKSRWDVLRRGQELGAALGVICTVADIVALAPHQERRFFHQSRHPAIGPMTTPGYPFRVMAKGEPSAPDWPPAPLLGQHTGEVLAAAGYAPQDLARLKQQGAIG